MWAASYNKTNIEEANKHLQALMDRVTELQSTVEQQADALVEKDRQMQVIVQEVAQKSQSSIAVLEEQLGKSDHKARRLESLLEEKETEVVALRQKCRMLDELVKYKSALAKLTISLEQAESFNNYAINRATYQQGDSSSSRLTNGGGATLAERAGRSVQPRDDLRPTDQELYL